jgi:hypothetical protein
VQGPAAGGRPLGRSALSTIAGRAADAAVSLAVYAGAGLAAVLLPLLRHGSGRWRHCVGGDRLSLLVMAALAFESEVLVRELPRLLHGGRLW